MYIENYLPIYLIILSHRLQLFDLNASLFQFVP